MENKSSGYNFFSCVNFEIKGQRTKRFCANEIYYYPLIIFSVLLLIFRISYSLFLIQSILKDADQSPGVDLKIMYDIGCVLSSHLKVS